MPKSQKLLQAVEDVLFREWDAIGVNHNELSRDEYSGYASTIRDWLCSDVDEFKLVAHLGQLQQVSMGMPVADEELNRRIARRLLELIA